MRGGTLAVAVAVVLAGLASSATPPIDRRAVVARYPLLTSATSAAALDSRDVFTMGNGDFGFSVDATGLQTLNATFASNGPKLDLNILSSWGFHSVPAIRDGTMVGARAALTNFSWAVHQTHTSANATRPIILATGENSTDGPLSGWDMSNPHRVGLGQLALRVVPIGESCPDPVAPDPLAITSLLSSLDTYTGAFSSSFTLAVSGPANPFCGSVGQYGDLQLQCEEPSAVISSIDFAHYGAPLAPCPTPVADHACDAVNVTAVVTALCLGRNNCSVPSGGDAWDNPCPGTAKALTVRATCSSGTGVSPNGGGSGVSTGAFAVTVDTVVHPDVDLVATRVSCTRVNGTSGCPTALRLAFPYSVGVWGATANAWPSQLDALHTTTVLVNASTRVSIQRTMDDFVAIIECAWNDSSWVMQRTGAHVVALFPPAGSPASASVELSCLFAPPGAAFPVGLTSSDYVQAKAASTVALLNGAPLPMLDATRSAAAAMYAAFWGAGAFVDLAGRAAGDPSAVELERRVVLSRYITRANSAGMTPPQETGLLSNSWSGKFHLEMRWWHQAHFALWLQPQYLDRSHAFYFDLLQNATSLATQQGYPGARWSKMLGLANRGNAAVAIDVPWLGAANGWGPPTPASGDAGLLLLWESANKINPVLMWNQPPVVWLADAVRRAVNATEGAAATDAAVRRLAPLVFATADFCAAQPFFNETSGFYELGAPTLGAEEYGDFTRIRKPLFETVYYAYALDVANEWRELLGLPRDAQYDRVAAGLGGLPLDPAQATPTYSFNAEAACCYVAPAACPPGRFGGRDQCSPRSGHPSPAGVLGLYDGRKYGDRYGVSAAAANATVAAITNGWGWSDGGGWGWDNPLVALGQIRNGWAPESVVAMLLYNDTHNGYWRTGWNWQGGFVYAPGNGGTLSAVAMMAAGTSTSPPCNFPAAWGATCEGWAMPYP